MQTDGHGRDRRIEDRGIELFHEHGGGDDPRQITFHRGAVHGAPTILRTSCRATFGMESSPSRWASAALPAICEACRPQPRSADACGTKWRTEFRRTDEGGVVKLVE